HHKEFRLRDRKSPSPAGRTANQSFLSAPGNRAWPPTVLDQGRWRLRQPVTPPGQLAAMVPTIACASSPRPLVAGWISQPPDGSRFSSPAAQEFPPVAVAVAFQASKPDAIRTPCRPAAVIMALFTSMASATLAASL